MTTTYASRQLFVPMVLVLSLVFYGYGSIPHLLLLLCLITISWGLARGFESAQTDKMKAFIIYIGVAINLSALAIWKYGNSLVETWNALGWVQVDAPGLLMPLGISFYIFQQLGYLLDLKRGRAQHMVLLEYAAFITFFPQILAGPIVTHRRMSREFAKVQGGRSMEVRLNMATQGIGWLALGLFKKVVIADSLGRIATPLISKATFGDLTLIEAWQISLSCPTRVYFDFCGYSEMAVGIGLFCGIKLPANFNAPFRAKTLRQFWTRWHITFHHFIRDHLYAPLSKKLHHKRFGMSITLFFTITLSSLWHGSSVQFFLWGVFVWVSMFLTTQLFSVIKPQYQRGIVACLTLTFFLFMGVLFVAPNLEIAGVIYKHMFAFETLGNGNLHLSTREWGGILVMVLIGIYARYEISTQYLISDKSGHRDRTFMGWRPPDWSANMGWLMFFAVLFCISFYFVGLSPPFVYFQF